MSGVAFLNAAGVYSRQCVFDVQERVMKNQKKAFFDAYCSFRQYGDAGDILRLLVRIHFRSWAKFMKKLIINLSVDK
jgi:hypothetical protein